MSSASPNVSARERRPRRWWVWLLVAALVMLAVAVVGGKAWIDHYLRSESFRSFISKKAGNTLKAQTEVAPLSFSGEGFYSDGLKAKGRENSWFSELQLDQVRADVSTRRFWEKVWQVEEVEIQRARIVLEGPRLPKEPKEKRPKSEPKKEPSEPGFFDQLLPNRVEVGAGIIRDAGIQWKEGGVVGSAIRVTPQEESWNFDIQGGTVTHQTLPPLEIAHARLRYREPSLFVQEAELRQDTGGTAVVSGEVKFDESLDLVAKLDSVTIRPYLGEDWRGRLMGKISGEVRVQTPLPAEDRPVISGTLQLIDGQLEALPILDILATFTRTDQFRRLNLTRASGELRHDSRGLQVRQLIVESAGLIRIEGDFDVVAGQIVGTFQLGVTSSTLQWLPGSQEKVFVVSRDGYLWAPMQVKGPVKKPKEDLSPRLAAAAKAALFEGTEGTVKDAAESALDAAKGAVDRLLGR